MKSCRAVGGADGGHAIMVLYICDECPPYHPVYRILLEKKSTYYVTEELASDKSAFSNSNSDTSLPLRKKSK